MRDSIYQGASSESVSPLFTVQVIYIPVAGCFKAFDVGRTTFRERFIFRRFTRLRPRVQQFKNPTITLFLSVFSSVFDQEVAVSLVPVCMQLCKRVSDYVRVCVLCVQNTHTFLHAHVHANVRTLLPACMHACMHICIYVCMHACIRVAHAFMQSYQLQPAVIHFRLHRLFPRSDAPQDESHSMADTVKCAVFVHVCACDSERVGGAHWIHSSFACPTRIPIPPPSRLF